MYWYFYCDTTIFGGQCKSNDRPWKINVTIRSGTNTPNVLKKLMNRRM